CCALSVLLLSRFCRGGECCQASRRVASRRAFVLAATRACRVVLCAVVARALCRACAAHPSGSSRRRPGWRVCALARGGGGCGWCFRDRQPFRSNCRGCFCWCFCVLRGGRQAGSVLSPVLCFFVFLFCFFFLRDRLRRAEARRTVCCARRSVLVRDAGV